MSAPEMNRTKWAVQVVDAAQLRDELARFERAYDMPSEEFLRRWSVGELDERPDFFRWYGTCHLAMKLGVLPPMPTPEWHAVG